ERPSHIIWPALHKTREQVSELFKAVHGEPHRTEEVEAMVESARRELRRHFLNAEVGISGANFLVADSGAVCTVTNEGNAELTTTPPRVHVVTAGIEKLVPSLPHAMMLLRLLVRSATGADLTQYTTFHTGPKRPGDRDGPEEFHIVLVDNGRSRMLREGLRDMLRCIRCGACMNHCPVYHAVGGHAYGWVYPGPMGAVLTPSLIGVDQAGHLPNASTFCGRCESVCPVRIPLPKLMRHWREREFERHLTPATVRSGLKFWGFFAKRPALYRVATRVAMGALALAGGRRGRFTWLPMSKGWTKYRDFPAPQGETFQQRWKRERRGASA
ncbi:MAG: LUD domain-containing protein, partial [Microvirga sp.]